MLLFLKIRITIKKTCIHCVHFNLYKKAPAYTCNRNWFALYIPINLQSSCFLRDILYARGVRRN
ncbi:hypothetical protein Hanom_Chr07g00626291 [Helianthus anomalus]